VTVVVPNVALTCVFEKLAVTLAASLYVASTFAATSAGVSFAHAGCA
jgi:hypothetical protein